MRKLAVALGVVAAVLFAGGIAWKANATTWRSGTLNLPSAAKNYREDGLWWMGAALPAGIHLVLWPIPVLVQTLLA